MFAMAVLVLKIATGLLCVALTLWAVALFAAINVSPASATQEFETGLSEPLDPQAPLTQLSGNESIEYEEDAPVDPPETPPPDLDILVEQELGNTNPAPTRNLSSQVAPQPQDKDPPEPNPPTQNLSEILNPTTDPPETPPPDQQAPTEEEPGQSDSDIPGSPGVDPVLEPEQPEPPQHEGQPPELNSPGELTPKTPTSPVPVPAPAPATKPQPTQPPPPVPAPTPKPRSLSAAPQSGTHSAKAPIFPGSSRPFGPQGYPAPAGGLIGDDYPMKYKRSSLYPIIWDEWNFAHRQCTSFVAWRLQEVNKVPFANSSFGVARWGNAGQWGDAARKAGFLVDRSPAVGAVAYNAPFHHGTGSAGHVAWVAEVLDDGRIIVEEYNYTKPGGQYQARIATKEAFTGFIHIRDLAEAPKRSASKPSPEATPVTGVLAKHGVQSAIQVGFNDSSMTMRIVRAFWFEYAVNPTGLQHCMRSVQTASRGDPGATSQCWFLHYFEQAVDPPAVNYISAEYEDNIMIIKPFSVTTASLCAVAILTGCDGAAPENTVNSIDELRAAYVATGAACEVWHEGTQQGLWSEFGNCDVTGATLSTYANVEDRDHMIEQLQNGNSLHSKVFVGPNWLITTDAHEAFATELGAEMIDLS